ncbi:MAG: non-canonical purine NTP diphosphatase [Bacteroidota bacterium]
MLELVFATQNPNKIIEVEKMLPDSLKIKGLKDIGCNEDIPETQNTLEGNALQKAWYIKNRYQVNCFADDTGLEIEALDGQPGVFSARYAGENKNSNDNIEKIWRELKNKTNRKAQFRTVIALLLDDEELTFEGIVKGEIIMEKRGSDGFGYDPVFIPQNYRQTFAEMPLKEKNKISHRYKAIKMLSEYLLSLNYI